MDLGRHLTTQNLLGTLDGQTGDLLTQDFTGLHGQLIGFGLGVSNNLGTFVGSTLFGVFDDGGCTLFSVSNALSDFVAGLAELFLDALVSVRQFQLCLVSRSQTVRDLGCALVESLRDRGPHEFHREPPQDPENHDLREQCCVQIHGSDLSRLIGMFSREGTDYLARAAMKGLANANSMAIPTAIRKAASIRPASRNILGCSSFISSGWRAADSRYLLPMMPLPIQAPTAPRPMIRPAARATKLMTSMMTPKSREWLARE